MIKKKIITVFLLIYFIFIQTVISSENNIYKKIDLFGEVLEKINKEYVDEINQPESMDSAINGLLQSLDPYSAYMSPEVFIILSSIELLLNSLLDFISKFLT